MMPVPWKLWEGQVVDLCLPLRQHLGGTDHSAVFLTQYGDPEPRNAVIKLVLAGAQDTELLAHWGRAAQLSHPHLLQLFRSGSCHLNQHALHYVVTEYAEENLADVLAERPLTVEEVREMLPPLLEALAYIHEEGLVHGHVKPANIMAVGDQLKLSVDGITTVEELGFTPDTPGAYDAPEFRDRGRSPMGDIWALGMTLVEALTQRLPIPGPKHEPVLPETLPAEFVPMVRACLRPDPRRRVPLDGIVAQFLQAGPEPAEPVHSNPPVAHRKRLGLALVATAAILLAAILAGPRLLQHAVPATATAAWDTVGPAPNSEAAKPERARAAAAVDVTPEAAPPVAAPAAPPPRAPSARGVDAKPGEVVHQVMPEVNEQARRSIRGKVTINVRARVDPAGHVTSARIESQNSRYFANLTLKAAEQWVFEGLAAGSEWRLRFEFTAKGTEVHLSRTAP
jgi:hypothetical protein